MTKDRLISEICDFGVIYSLYLKQGRRAILRVSWEVSELETHSCVYELDLARSKLIALGRKGNNLLPAERFSAEKLCAWARRELFEFSGV